MSLRSFSSESQELLQEAQSEAIRREHAELHPEHLLFALSRTALLESVGVMPEVIRKKLQPELDRLPRLSTGSGQVAGSGPLNQLIAFAEGEAQALSSKEIKPEHWLLAWLNPKLSKTICSKILIESGLTRDRLVSVREGETEQSSLKKYCRDLTEAAKNQKLDPVIGRDEEIRRLIQVLSRRTKNNPVLIGEPGVGKTAIAEGLALRIAAGDVSEGLKDKQVLVLDLASMIAGAKFRGEFEERLKNVLSEIKKSNGEIILFIDELHTLVGAGAADGAMDASNMLKPALARGEIHCIGATTLDEYKKHIEKDAALERRFQPIFVKEPTVEDTISILRGLRERYEVHHGVSIRDAAIVAAATLSNRYIADRFLPDKAIDLVDEAASKLRVQMDSRPEKLDQISRKVLQFEIEREALKKESDRASQERMKDLESQISTLKTQMTKLQKTWESEKSAGKKISDLKEKIEKTKIEAEIAEREGNLEKAAELKYGKLTGFQKTLESMKNEGISNTLLRQEVTEDDIADVVSRWTGVPVSKLLESEQKKLLQMEANLESRVIGQKAALTAVSNAVRRSRAGLQDTNRPIGSFLFLGPTGVGKTETAKALAEFLFDDERAMVRIDMSEYMEKHSVSRLIGAPPGYVGYDEGGSLTEAVRRRPYCVILLDEIEKAHPDVFNVFLQILDDGRATDGQGRTVFFNNALLIMTSNIGSHTILNETDPERVRELVSKELKGHFRPEFLNRIDDTIIFSHLEKATIEKIVETYLTKLNRRLSEKGLKIELSAALKAELVEKGYDPNYGARPLKRVFQNEVENSLAPHLLSGDFAPGSIIKGDLERHRGKTRVIFNSQ